MICRECRSENLDGSESCFQCGASFGVSGRRAITKGTLIARRYEIQELLGRGGMGTVYKAHDQTLDESVALKLLRAEIAQSGEMARRFLTEIKLARRVTHKNVCRIHEYGVDDELSFISMEFLEGVDLKRVLREQGRLDPALALRLSIQVCDGLQAIHEVGVVHRDLKTANLMLNLAGVVKLMDFGIAKQTGVAGDPTGATQTGAIIGTPEYMSPEQARGEKVDGRSDIYALGIVLFELFTGDVPFRADTPIATILKHIGEPPPLRGGAGHALPLPIVPILERALAKAPQERYGSVVEMGRALQAVTLEGPVATVALRLPPVSRGAQRAPLPASPTPRRLPLPAPAPTPVPARTLPPPLPTPAPTPLLLRALPWAGLGLALVTLGGASAWLLWTGISVPASPTPAVAETEAATPAAPAPPTTSRPLASMTPAAEPRVLPKPTPSPPVVKSLVVAPSAPPVTTRAEATPFPAPSRRQLVFSDPTPTPEPVASATPSLARAGLLQLLVVPWAEVFIEGRSVGTTPMKPISLPEGTHLLRLVHPDYHPLQKRVSVRGGDTVRLEVDLKQEGFPKLQE